MYASITIKFVTSSKLFNDLYRPQLFSPLAELIIVEFLLIINLLLKKFKLIFHLSLLLLY